MIHLPFTRRKAISNAMPRPSGEVAWLRDLRLRIDGLDADQLFVDFAEVEKINSRELGELAKIELQLRERDSRLVVQNAQEFVSEVFELTRMNRLIEVRPVPCKPH
jgi:anti-anti-sigma regulatory factor